MNGFTLFLWGLRALIWGGFCWYVAATGVSGPQFLVISGLSFVLSFISEIIAIRRTRREKLS